MRKSLLVAGALCALLSTGFAATAPASAAAPAPGSSLTLRGTILSIANPGPTETLTVARAGNGVHWTVTLSATTTVELRGGAPSSAAALFAGDAVLVNGTVGGERMLNASTVRDLSQVDHATGIEGVVRSVVPLSGGITQVQIQTGRASDDGFIARGRRLLVDVTATTPITLPDGTAGTIGALTVGTLVRVAGIYDSAANALVAPDYVKLLAAPRDCDRDNGLFCRHAIAGRLIYEPSTTAPATIAVRLGNGAVISVTVSTTTTIMRRYDGAANLSELALGDALQINGSFDQASPRTFDATRIEDVSQQEAYTGAVVRLANLALGASAGVVTGEGVVLSHEAGAPYRYGEVLSLLFNANTAVVKEDGTAGTLADLSTLRYGEHISVSGRYDRVSHLLIVLKVHL